MGHTVVSVLSTNDIIYSDVKLRKSTKTCENYTKEFLH